MTKRRAPLTPHLALTQVAGLIGWTMTAELCGRRERTVRDWSDPDVDAEISYRDAIRLDAAYIYAGGEVAPFLTVFQARLDLATAERASSVTGRIERTATLMIESGEASAALTRLHRPGATLADELIARREVAQLIEAAAAVHADLPIEPGAPDV